MNFAFTSYSLIISHRNRISILQFDVSFLLIHVFLKRGIVNLIRQGNFFHDGSLPTCRTSKDGRSPSPYSVPLKKTAIRNGMTVLPILYKCSPNQSRISCKRASRMDGFPVRERLWLDSGKRTNFVSLFSRFNAMNNCSACSIGQR